MIEKHFQTILDDPRCLVLTPNKRLARYLQRNLEVKYQETGQVVWPTPHCLPLDMWLKHCFKSLQMTGLVEPMMCINNEQKQLLWESIIKQWQRNNPLIETQQLVQSAINAWDIIQAWQLSKAMLVDAYLTFDQQQFLVWYEKIENIYRERHYLDDGCLATYLSTHVDQMNTRFIQHCLPSQILCVAFDALTPAQQTWFSALGKLGIPVTMVEDERATAQVMRCDAPNKTDEIRAMVNWAQQLLEHDPHATIACIDPSLQQNRHMIIKQVMEIFSPEKCFIDQQDTLLPVNISGGDTLAQTPIIHTAIQWLRFILTTCDIEDFANLIRSDFYRHASQHHFAHARKELTCRQLGITNINLSQFIHWQTRMADMSTDAIFDAELLDACKMLEKQIATLPTQQSHREWAATFQQCLQGVGWPGEIDITSMQYQRLMHWEQALVTLGQLDEIESQCHAVTALARLQKICEHTLFQAQTQDTPVQVLGLLEAAGIAFDHVWMMGLDNQTLPQAANPNPFLPYAIQRDHHCPHATPSRELAFAQAMLQRFQCSTKKTLILSFAQSDQDEARQASPLIGAFPVNAELMQVAKIPITKQIMMQQAFECLADELGPTITTLQMLPGGSQQLAHYSACHFRGFTYARLLGSSIEPFQSEFSPVKRGLYCHSAMEWLWKKIKTQQVLLSMTSDARDKLLDQAVEQGITSNVPLALSESKQHLFAVEKACIKHILQQWLTQETARKPFIVTHTEEKQKLQLGHCQLITRIDRIDLINQGTSEESYVIIDYKTGEPNVEAWFDERIDDPQLPLYVIQSPLPISGVLFAKLRADEQIYLGVTASDQHVATAINLAENENRLDWPALKAHWRSSIDKITHTLESGDAKLNPKYGELTCRYCECAAFCRRQEKEELHDA